MHRYSAHRVPALPPSWKGILSTLAMITTLLTAPASADDNAVAMAEGLWEYTGLVTKDGTSLPLTGVFLISEGTFVQQSIFNGEPFSDQGSMAHVGPYWAGGAGVRLTSRQTLSMSPTEGAPLSSAGEMQHDLAVTRDGDELTLVFGGGTSTVQTFRRLGDARDTQHFTFAEGGLSLADDYFILVLGNDDFAVSGYGIYRQSGDVLTLDAIRWSASDGSAVINLKDAIITATFDGTALTLPGGQHFKVIPGEDS